MNLYMLFGKRYAIAADPSFCADCPELLTDFRPEAIPWQYQEIRGRYGWVYPYSETELAVVLPTRAARRLAKLIGPELALLQHADREKCYKVDAKHAEILVRFIKPKSLRQLTSAHKSALAKRLNASRHKRWQAPTKYPDPLVKQPVIAPGTMASPLANPGVDLDIAPLNRAPQKSSPFVQGRPL